MSRTSQVLTDQNMYRFFGSLQLDTETTTLTLIPKQAHTKTSLVGGFNPSEKYESPLGYVGMMKFPTYGKIKAMFQTTNQIIFVDSLDLTHVARKTDMLQPATG